MRMSGTETGPAKEERGRQTMYVLVKSDEGGLLTSESKVWSFIDYDDAFSALKGEVLDEIAARGIDEEFEGDYGFDYDTGHGFAGAYNGVELQIFAVD